MLAFRVIPAHHPRPAASPRYLCSRCLPQSCRGISAIDTSSLLSFGLSRHSPLTAVFLPFPFNRLRTLSFSVSRKSFACHSYENCRVWPNSSHCGTRYEFILSVADQRFRPCRKGPLIAHHFARPFFSCTYNSQIPQLLSFDIHANWWGGVGGAPNVPTFKRSTCQLFFIYPLSFHTIPNCFAMCQRLSHLFSGNSELFAQNTRGWGRGEKKQPLRKISLRHPATSPPEVEIGDDAEQDHAEGDDAREDAEPREHERALVPARRRRGDSRHEVEPLEYFCQEFDHGAPEELRRYGGSSVRHRSDFLFDFRDIHPYDGIPRAAI